MHSYLHHIQDFLTATIHLTRVERSIYLDLIWLYYDTEEPLQNDIKFLAKKIRATEPNLTSTDVQQVLNCVEGLLNEFFELTDSGWYQDRCEVVIDHYKSNTSKKSMAGKKSAERKKQLKRQRIQQLKQSNTCSTDVQQAINKPSTEGQQNATKPINHKTNKPTILSPEGDSQFDLFWSRYPRTKSVSKQKAKVAWSKLSDGERLKALDVVESFRQHWSDHGTEEKFIPHPATWINGKYFENPPSSGGNNDLIFT